MTFPIRVEHLALRGFRNLKDLAIEPGPHFNVIHGDNGQGKSNLLEAIYYLSSLQSFRCARTEDIIEQDSAQAVLEAKFFDEPMSHHCRIELSRDKSRKIALNSKRPSSHAQYRTVIQAVVFHPGHLSLATGAADARRSFIDTMIERMDASYAPTLAAYNKALRSRNRLLKDETVSRDSLEIYNTMLAQSGAVIGKARSKLIDTLSPEVERAFSEIMGEDVQLRVGYLPKVEPEPAAILCALRESIDKDLARKYTTQGPHGDDLGLDLKLPQAESEHRAKHFASQGQQRAIVLALKVGELYLISRSVERVPILLLDDVSSELDRSRNRRLFDLLSKLGGQVFLTSTHPEFILLDRDRQEFQVDSGNVRRL